MSKKIMSKEVFDQIKAEYGNDFAMTEFRKSLDEVKQFETSYKKKKIKFETGLKKPKTGQAARNQRRKKKKEGKNSWNKNLKEFAKSLNNKNIPSEIWFKKLFQEHLIETKGDKYNKTFYGMYIPDIINKANRYIIEIDGSIHLKPDQIEKDKKKDLFYESKGYRVFRVVHLDYMSYIRVIDEILKIKKMTPSKKYLDFVKLYIIK